MHFTLGSAIFPLTKSQNMGRMNSISYPTYGGNMTLLFIGKAINRLICSKQQSFASKTALLPRFYPLTSRRSKLSNECAAISSR